MTSNIERFFNTPTMSQYTFLPEHTGADREITCTELRELIDTAHPAEQAVIANAAAEVTANGGGVYDLIKRLVDACLI